MRLFGSLIRKFKALLLLSTRADERFDRIATTQGLVLATLNAGKTSRDLKDFEFSVFSQWGEDGIIQRLIDLVPIKNKTFVEFGVETFSEANCRFLMVKDNWRGFIIDGSSDNIAALKASYYFWKYDLKAISAFVDKDNINGLIAQSNFDRDVGILSVDIDGNDYFVLDAISGISPRIIIVEYNGTFGPDRKIVVPYDKSFWRNSAHYSNLYWGASLGALADVARSKGYSLVGVNSSGVNAFFVRDDLITPALEVLSVKDAFVLPHFRDSRNAEGGLTYLDMSERMAVIKGMPVLNIETGVVEPL
ncbi:hypothetical protein [Devosia sp.]|uniref:hypothetical protein n=1 Tax=Devosia sp. TaxID=1871048 RepID=UPI003267BD5B